MRLRDLQPEVCRHAAHYETHRPDCLALAPYATADALLAAVRLSSPIGYGERVAITVALVQAQQRKPHPLWQGILICAYAPMLWRLRGRLGRPSDDGLDQEVVVAFLEAIAAIDLPSEAGRIPMYLRQRTTRIVATGLRRKRRDAALELFDEETYVPPEPEPQGSERLQELLAQASGPCNAELLITLGVELRAAVYAAFPDLDPRDLERVYRRLQRQRHRALIKLQRRRAARLNPTDAARATSSTSCGTPLGSERTRALTRS